MKLSDKIFITALVLLSFCLFYLIETQSKQMPVVTSQSEIGRYMLVNKEYTWSGLKNDPKNLNGAQLPEEGRDK